MMFRCRFVCVLLFVLALPHLVSCGDCTEQANAGQHLFETIAPSAQTMAPVESTVPTTDSGEEISDALALSGVDGDNAEFAFEIQAEQRVFAPNVPFTIESVMVNHGPALQYETSASRQTHHLEVTLYQNLSDGSVVYVPTVTVSSPIEGTVLLTLGEGERVEDKHHFYMGAPVEGVYTVKVILGDVEVLFPDAITISAHAS